MWMSNKISTSHPNSFAEKGSVTLSSSQLEAGATVINRDIESCAPYGYHSKPPMGEDVVVLPWENGQVMLGSLCVTENLESGEIKLLSKGGACILLKNDGSVIINSLVINSDGVIENDNDAD